jgi:hypothetical protein
MFFSPFCMVLVDDKDERANLNSTLDVVPKGEWLPEEILTKLNRFKPALW